MTIRDIVSDNSKLPYKELCAALIERFGVRQPVNWDSVLPYAKQQNEFGGETLRLVADHPTLDKHKEIRPICLMKGEVSQLLFFFMRIDEKISKSDIERVTRKFVGGIEADRYIIWFFGNKSADVLKVVISGKEGKKVRIKTLSLEAGKWFKTYDYILTEVETKFNTSGLFQQLKEPSGLWKALWEAFDISIVNKKFYAEIKTVFDALTEHLSQCKGILTNKQDRVWFAIRLIGRIIFCWFLKKKGIISDEVLSSYAVGNIQDYYHSILEPLFFEVFNKPKSERKKDLPESIKDYPFLNGGLFEAQTNDYHGNWALYIPDDWFKKFFGDTLEKYNFTIDENTSSSSEIAIDPEMLGRIFENLLAEQNPETGESARKSTGAYYTPREIVEFMVEESLIGYLKTVPRGMDELSMYPLSKKIKTITDEEIADFVHTETPQDSLKHYAKALLDKLGAIKVLDPACGSGAFPISMLQKITALKQQLDQKTKPYEHKLRTIENSIYGADIQPMATELSRLRCWLSLIVDAPSDDIKPLPNLDFKFVTANSLIDLGYDEFIEKIETGKLKGGGLLLNPFKTKLKELHDVRRKYFESFNQKDKDNLKKEFKSIQDSMFIMSLELIKRDLIGKDFFSKKIDGWDPFDDSKPAPFFNRSWMFGIEDGFDAVIGNPPYVQIQKFARTQTQKDLEGVGYQTFAKTGDIYCLFYERALKLAKQKTGLLSFITSNKWMRAGYGDKLRGYFASRNPIKLLDFGGFKVFEAATVDTNILIIENKPNENKLHACHFENDYKKGDELSEYFGKNNVELKNLSSISWFIGNSAKIALKAKIEAVGKPLKEWDVKINRGVLTGLNEAFIINQ